MRDLLQSRELAAPELVEDLPGLLLGELVDLLPLVAREQPQRAAREIGVPAKRLVRGDERVAPEGHRVPGDARGGERPALVELEQGAKVERAARDEPVVQRLRARLVTRAAAQESLVARVERVERVVEAAGRRRLASAVLTRDDRDLEREDLLRRELARDEERRALDAVWCR